MNPLTTEQIYELEKSLDAHIKYYGIKRGEYNNWLYTTINSLQLKALIQSARELVEAKAELAAIEIGIHNKFKSGKVQELEKQVEVATEAYKRECREGEAAYKTLLAQDDLTARKLSVAIDALKSIEEYWNGGQSSSFNAAETMTIRTQDALKTIAEMK